MSCIHQSNPYAEGSDCGCWTEGVFDINLGTDKQGNCLVSDDESPSDSCFYYESAEDCEECGLNEENCECG